MGAFVNARKITGGQLGRGWGVEEMRMKNEKTMSQSEKFIAIKSRSKFLIAINLLIVALTRLILQH